MDAKLVAIPTFKLIAFGRGYIKKLKDTNSNVIDKIHAKYCLKIVNAELKRRNG
jgi:hypothetical protein